MEKTGNRIFIRDNHRCESLEEGGEKEREERGVFQVFRTMTMLMKSLNIHFNILIEAFFSLMFIS